MKNSWKGITEIIPLKRTDKTPTILVLNNKTLTDSKSIASAFKEFFSNIGN